MDNYVRGTLADEFASSRNPAEALPLSDSNREATPLGTRSRRVANIVRSYPVLAEIVQGTTGLLKVPRAQVSNRGVTRDRCGQVRTLT